MNVTVEDLRKRMATAAEAASRITAPDGDAYAQGVKAALEAVRGERPIQYEGFLINRTDDNFGGFCRAIERCESAVSRLLGVGK